MADTNSFLPAFGNKPKNIIGRKGITVDFVTGLSLPIGHRQRATILVGQRGTGKTALLLEFSELAEKNGFVVARVTASETMLDEIIQTIQIAGAPFVATTRPKIKGFSAGALGFSFGLTFTEETKTQFGFRVKLSMLCEELGKYQKGVLILVDEVQANTPEMRVLATTYQNLVGDNKNIAMVMAGLPTSISAVLNDDILTFLNRAHKVYLEPLPYGEISISYAAEFTKLGRRIDADALESAVTSTRGYAYLYQLIGYYTLNYAQNSEVITAEIVKCAVRSSQHEMVESIFTAALKPLSARDVDFLKAMSRDVENSRISDIRERMKVSQSYVQKYRTRLIEAGVIASVSRGELTFLIPYLGEYLRGEF
jgi:hypothetical protein